MSLVFTSFPDNMGIITSYIWKDTGKDDDPDPKTGLTSRERYLLKTTWNRLTDRGTHLETGMAIFTKLFEKHPRYQKLFPFNDLARNELNSNSKFRAHSMNIMYALTCIIDNVDDPLMLEQLLIKQGTNHVSRNVPDQAYWDLKTVLLSLFANSMNETEVQAWEKFLDLGFGIIVRFAKEARKS